MGEKYTIYAGHCRPGGWIVRAYRDSDHKHLHSAEGLGTNLTAGLKEVERAIIEDAAHTREAPRG